MMLDTIKAKQISTRKKDQFVETEFPAKEVIAIIESGGKRSTETFTSAEQAHLDITYFNNTLRPYEKKRKIIKLYKAIVAYKLTEL